MTKILGISCFSHDAAVAVVDNGNILFAAHAERYSGIKNDKNLNKDLIEEALRHGLPDKIAFYERPLLKKTRQLYAGQWKDAFDPTVLLASHIRDNYPELLSVPIEYVDHHLSHAAAAMASDFDESLVVVIDAIGEWDCLTIWKYTAPNNFEKLESWKYPDSLGLFYTAMTDRIGFKPNEDEYILMGLSAYGTPIYTDDMLSTFFNEHKVNETKHNLHIGAEWYQPGANDEDIAASAQAVIENKIKEIMKRAKAKYNSNNLVYSGGVALNCVANNMLSKLFGNVWILPNPGDAGSSLGAAAIVGDAKLVWNNAFLGHNITGDYPVKETIDSLLSGSIVGVANGKAEFGPRALGNRTLFGDPRDKNIKDKLNTVKNRQKFRPFGVMVLEDQVLDYFEETSTSPYMQYTAKVKDPDTYPGITHVDGTTRIQTITKEENPNAYKLLTEWHIITGCGMLINSSLNIKGKPIVNTEADATDFENKYNVPVYTRSK